MKVNVLIEENNGIISNKDINEKLDGLKAGEVFQLKGYSNGKIVEKHFLVLKNERGAVTPILSMTDGMICDSYGADKARHLPIENVFEVGVFDRVELKLNDFEYLGGK